MAKPQNSSTSVWPRCGAGSAEIGDQRHGDLARLGQDILRHCEDVEQQLGAADDDHRDEDDGQHLAPST